jgi:hypothetical protein
VPLEHGGHPARADAEPGGALVQAQSLIPVGGHHGDLVDPVTGPAQSDPLTGQELGDRGPGHPEQLRALRHRQPPVLVGGGHRRGTQRHRAAHGRSQHSG